MGVVIYMTRLYQERSPEGWTSKLDLEVLQARKKLSNIVITYYHHHNIANIHVLGSVLSTLPISPQVLLTTTLGSGSNYYPSFTGKETEAHESKVTCTKFHS